MANKYQIPFDKDGNQLRYDMGRVDEWRDNIQFVDTLTYTGYSKGNSSIDVLFTRSDGATVSFFMSDLDALVPHMTNGKISGSFEFVKRGKYYGCKSVNEPTETTTFDAAQYSITVKRRNINGFDGFIGTVVEFPDVIVYEMSAAAAHNAIVGIITTFKKQADAAGKQLPAPNIDNTD